MGQAQSTDGVKEALEDVDAGLKQQAASTGEKGIKLFRFIRAGNTGNWELASSNARPRFYDAKEDSTTSGQADWFLEVEGGDVDARVDQDLGYVMDLKQRRITFSAGGTCWALRFPTDELYKSFAEELNDKAFYNAFGMENDVQNRAKELGDDYAGIFFSKNMAHRVDEPMDTDPELDTNPSPERMMKDQEAKQAADDDEDNTYQGIIMGANENNYLMRGRHFDVLRNAEGGVTDKGVSFALTPMKGTPGFKAAGTPLRGGGGGPGVTPSRVLLADCERKMNLLTPENPNILHHADIEAQKIVSTWQFQKDGADIPIRDITHEDKGGQLDERTTFLGLDANRLCKWDLRDPHGVVATTPVVQYCPGGKDYSRGTNFTCMATSGDGYVAVGSKDGKIRLYNNKTMTQAKTSIPGLGAPITSIDVTHDGKWVLATTDRYLMVVKTTYEDDKGRDANGFTSRMGGRGAVPRLLRLKPEDAARTGGKPLAKGKFTWITEHGISERWVVANCGNFSVVWNFNRVKAAGADSLSYGGLPTSMDYLITSKDEDVVDAAFLHHKYAKHGAVEQAALVVATPHRLFNLGS